MKKLAAIAIMIGMIVGAIVVIANPLVLVPIIGMDVFIFWRVVSE